MFVETNLSFYVALFLILLLTSLTAQGLLLQRMQPWSSTCSQVAPGNGIFDGDIHSTFFNFGGAMLTSGGGSSSGGGSLWWSSFFTQLRLRPVVEVFLLLLLLCSPCPLWWSDGYWHRPVHTAMQLSEQVSYLLCTRPRVRSPRTTILVGNRPSSTSSIFREEEVAALF